MFLLGLTGIAILELRHGTFGITCWLAIFGVVAAVLSWWRGVGSATGLYFLEPVIYANVPAFAWLGGHGLHIAAAARRMGAAHE